jgi:hypothetical protein
MAKATHVYHRLAYGGERAHEAGALVAVDSPESMHPPAQSPSTRPLRGRSLPMATGETASSPTICCKRYSSPISSSSTRVEVMGETNDSQVLWVSEVTTKKFYFAGRTE